jgi:hypothetical protein
MIFSERVVGHNPWAEAFVLCPEEVTGFSTGFNPGNRPPRATRPEGGARSNVLKAEPGPDGPMVARPNNAKWGQVRCFGETLAPT